jgi:hypothetical protein
VANHGNASCAKNYGGTSHYDHCAVARQQAGDKARHGDR